MPYVGAQTGRTTAGPDHGTLTLQPEAQEPRPVPVGAAAGNPHKAGQVEVTQSKIFAAKFSSIYPAVLLSLSLLLRDFCCFEISGQKAVDLKHDSYLALGKSHSTKGALGNFLET